MSEIRAIAKRIAERFEVDKIILFGSYAYGRPNQGSDVDLLVVMQTPKRHSELRFEMCTVLQDCPFPVDIVFRDPEQVKKAHLSRDWFLQDVLAKGRLVYG